MRGKDVRTGTLRTSDVADSSLLARDFAAGQLPAGPQGPGGPAGQDGFGLLTYQFGNADVANGADARPTADCPSGTSATGGSVYAYSQADISNVTNQVMTAQGFNFSDPVGWYAQVINNTGGDVSVVVNVACANADTVTVANTKQRQRR